MRRIVLALCSSLAVFAPIAAAMPLQHGATDQAVDQRDGQQDGLDLLRAADEALRQAAAFSFEIRREGSGAQATREPATIARVVVSRLSGATRAGLYDDNGAPQWRVAAFGRVSDPSGEGDYWPFAFTLKEERARYVDRTRVALIEGAPESAAEMLEASGARAALQWLSEWETLVGRPIVDNTPRVEPKYDGNVLVGEEITRAVYVDLAEFPGTYAFGAWWYLGAADSLPRRLELVYYDVRDEDNQSVGDGISRLTISNIQTLQGEEETARAVRAAAGILDETNWLQPGDMPLAGLIGLEAPFDLPSPEGFEVVEHEPAAVEQGIAIAPEPDVNVPAPDFTLLDPQGNEHTLSSYRGKIVVLDFWATWCAPCLVVMPHLQAIHEEYTDKGVIVIGVNAWENGDPAALMSARGWDYLLLLNGNQVAADYQVTSIPTMIVVDQQGMIVRRKVGAGPGLKEQLSETISTLLDEQ